MKKYLSVFCALAVFLFAAQAVKAEDDQPGLRDRIKNQLQVSTPRPSPIRQREENQERRVVGLGEVSLRACEARGEAIRIRQESLVRLSTGHLKRMDALMEKVEKYYQETLVPEGKKVENYDALVTDIKEKRNMVLTSLEEATKAMEGFECNADDPKGLYMEFRNRMQETKNNLFQYRRAIKELVGAVRKIAVDLPKASPSPESE